MDKKSIEELFNDTFDDLEQFEEDNLTHDYYKKINEQFGINLKELEDHFQNSVPRKEIPFVKISEDAVTPKYAYETDSGFDLHSIEDVVIDSLDRKLVSTGLRFSLPENHEMQIRPKSGLALNLGLTVLNTPGTIDEGYDGEIKVILFNASKTPIEIKKGMKIAQAVICPVVAGKWHTLVEKSSINKKERGSNGFGSTGINI